LIPSSFATTAGAVNTIAAGQADRTTVHTAITTTITTNAIVVRCRGTTTTAAAVAHRLATDRAGESCSTIARLACGNRGTTSRSRAAAATTAPLVAISAVITLSRSAFAAIIVAATARTDRSASATAGTSRPIAIASIAEPTANRDKIEDGRVPAIRASISVATTCATRADRHLIDACRNSKVLSVDNASTSTATSTGVRYAATTAATNDKDIHETLPLDGQGAA
jgi:hypothetical protein